jgi:hypothetical protein
LIAIIDKTIPEVVIKRLNLEIKINRQELIRKSRDKKL